jgi:hypothetical protein
MGEPLGPVPVETNYKRNGDENKSNDEKDSDKDKEK